MKRQNLMDSRADKERSGSPAEAEQAIIKTDAVLVTAPCDGPLGCVAVAVVSLGKMLFCVR